MKHNESIIVMHDGNPIIDISVINIITADYTFPVIGQLSAVNVHVRIKKCNYFTRL